MIGTLIKRKQEATVLNDTPTLTFPLGSLKGNTPGILKVWIRRLVTADFELRIVSNEVVVVTKDWLTIARIEMLFENIQKNGYPVKE